MPLLCLSVNLDAPFMPVWAAHAALYPHSVRRTSTFRRAAAKFDGDGSASAQHAVLALVLGRFGQLKEKTHEHTSLVDHELNVLWPMLLVVLYGIVLVRDVVGEE